MSVIDVGGVRYAAGLYWLSRGGRRATARTARRLGRPWCVHRGERTGFAPDGGPAVGLGPAGSGPSGLPALALALMDLIDGEFWMALVEGAGDGGGDTRAADTRAADTRAGDRYALVKARNGTILADGDETFDERAAALAAFERAREQGWSLFATPGLLDELGGPGRDVAPLDPAALAGAAEAAGAEIVLSRAVPAGRRDRRPLAVAAGLVVLAAVAGAWFGRDALVAWLVPPAPEPAPSAEAPEPLFPVSVDGAALIAACRQALIDNPPFLPAWRIERIACEARFGDAELTGVRPELAGRPVLLVRWRLAAGHAEAMQRRLAEAHLGRWLAAQVSDGRAWAAAELSPVLRLGEAEAPSLLALRRAVDRAFGAGGAGLGFGPGAGGAWTLRIDDPGPLDRLGPLVGGIAGLEIVSLSRGEDSRAGGVWRLEGRPVAPERLTAAGLRALGIETGGLPGAAEGMETRPGAGSDEGPGELRSPAYRAEAPGTATQTHRTKEVQHGTQ